jgi:thiol:disulfide interchange protein DsbC
MRRIARLAAISLLAVGVGPAAADAGTDAVLKRLRERLPDVQVERIEALPYTNLYEARGPDNSAFYLDGDASFLISGELFDLTAMLNVTRLRAPVTDPKDVSAFPGELAIEIRKGNGSRRVLVFSDPDCGYCRQLEQEMKAIDDVTIRVYMLPVDALHPVASERAHAIWCSPDRVRAWHEYMVENVEPPPAPSSCKAPLAGIAELAAANGLQGTPVMVFASGRVVPGAVPASYVERFLSEPPLAR